LFCFQFHLIVVAGIGLQGIKVSLKAFVPLGLALGLIRGAIGSIAMEVVRWLGDGMYWGLGGINKNNVIK